MPGQPLIQPTDLGPRSISRVSTARIGVRNDLILGVLLGLLALVVVHVVLADTYWNSEEGIYALSARLLLVGHPLYRETVAGQPPGTFLVGAALLAIHGGLEWLRASVAVFQLAAGVIGAEIVWRVSGSRVASLAVPPLALLAPWAVHEHGTLTPEVVSLPFLLGAVLASNRPRATWLAGLLCGLLPLIKLPFILPALVIVLLSANPPGVGAWASATLASLLTATLIVGGGAFWQDAVVAQTKVGTQPLGFVIRSWAQLAWNLIGPVVGLALALAARHRARDVQLLRTLLGALLATGAVALLSVFKHGTTLNVVVPLEALLIPCAVAGVALVARRRATIGLTRAAWLGVLALVFTVGQGVSLMAAPSDPTLFERLGSARLGWVVLMRKAQFERAVTQARSCPSGSVWGGAPLIAFAAGRRVPADQPDTFISTAPNLRRVYERMQAVSDVCRPPAP